MGALLQQPSVWLCYSYRGREILLLCGPTQSMLPFSLQLLLPVWRFITSVQQPGVFTVLVAQLRGCECGVRAVCSAQAVAMEKGAACPFHSLPKASQCCSMAESPDIPNTFLELSLGQQISYGRSLSILKQQPLSLSGKRFVGSLLSWNQRGFLSHKREGKMV